MRRAVLILAGVLLAPRAAEAGNGKNLLGWVGEDAEMVAVIDVADARDSDAFATFLQFATDEGWAAAIGMELDANVDTVLVATGAGRVGVARIVIVEGAVSVPSHDGLDEHRHRGVTYWTYGEREIAMIGKRLVVTDAGAMDGVIDRAKKKSKKSLTRSSKAAGLRATIAATDTRHDIWMAAGSGVLPGIDSPGISFGLSLATDVAVEVRLLNKDAAAATTLGDLVNAGLDQIRQQLGQFGLSGFADSLAVDVDGDVVELAATLPGDELASMLALARGFL